MSKINISAVDLFCGAGGLTCGLARSGIDVRLGVDIDPSCEYPYTHNNQAKFVRKSVGDIGADDLRSYYTQGSVRLLAGCAPCQTFSRYNLKASKKDDRWWLLRHFARLVLDLEPELVTMENVPGLMDHEVFTEFVDTLVECNYFVSFQPVNCEEYGIPQHRRRLVLLASRFGPIELISPKVFKHGRVSVRSAIGNSKVSELEAGSKDTYDVLHQSAALSPLNMKRIKASKPGGTWRDWDPELVAGCHKKASGKSYPGVYGRMAWDEPAPTITTQFYGFGNGRFGHPEQDRALSLREGAILQSFPSAYEFVAPGEKVRKKIIGRLIGNAVPVLLGKAIGLSIQANVKAHYSSNAPKGSRMK